jgi:hypothetical protein
LFADFSAKVVQAERKTKRKSFFLCFSEVPPADNSDNSNVTNVFDSSGGSDSSDNSDVSDVSDASDNSDISDISDNSDSYNSPKAWKIVIKQRNFVNYQIKVLLLEFYFVSLSSINKL